MATTLGTRQPKEWPGKYEERFAATNAPRQPRRWQHSGARQSTSWEMCQSRAQVKSRASGVALHAVVRRRHDVRRCFYSSYLSGFNRRKSLKEIVVRPLRVGCII